MKIDFNSRSVQASSQVAPSPSETLIISKTLNNSVPYVIEYTRNPAKFANFLIFKPIFLILELNFGLMDCFMQLSM